jgi:hypothetical protein
MLYLNWQEAGEARFGGVFTSHDGVSVEMARSSPWLPHRVTVNAIAPGVFMTEPNLR